MPRSFSRTTSLWTIIALLATMLAPFALTASALPHAALAEQPALTGAPEVDPHFIYTQLDYMATNFLKRESGYDNTLPPTINGHDEFANYWTQQMLSLLGSYGAQARRDPFPIKGWQARPTTVPAFNVEITVPGIVHPEQIVVIGCHYDGMAFSTQSANDDASGCAIELGVAKAMSEFWNRNHVYPARTLRFVIFDAEESGLFGSYHYVNNTSNGDLQNIVAMFNEEQNGIDYPLRYLGKMSNPLMPYYIDMSPLQSNTLYSQNNLTPQQRANIGAFRQLMQQAVAASFQEFRALGNQMLTYHASPTQDVWQPIFTPDQLSNIHLEDDTLGASDQMPFTLAGLPCATLVGNSTYYDQKAPDGSYPYDQPGDTIQLMNTFADGTAAQSQALTLALGLPGMITSWMLSQSSILGQAPADGKPLAAIDSIGPTQTGHTIQFAAGAAFDPAQPGASFNYRWNFGDGSSATGQSVSHTYASAGTYTLSVAVTSSSGSTRTITQKLTIAQPAIYANPYNDYVSTGMPPASSSVILPASTNGPGDRVGTTADATQGGPITNTGSLREVVANPHPGFPLIWLLLGVVVLFILIVAAVILRWGWRR
jgi:hypothetical protein